ncbi:MAG: hypothetical protein LKE36_04915 [Bacilli bacterium]|jgi:hypothetical protein|nr:hypothetical protein [Bacilli bacterium]MCH4202535.1 hypothetical protein [Bacilli bacterium]
MKNAIDVTLFYIAVILIVAFAIIIFDRELKKHRRKVKMIKNYRLSKMLVYYRQPTNEITLPALIVNFFYYGYALYSLVTIILYWVNNDSIYYNHLAVYSTLALLSFLPLLLVINWCLPKEK